MSIFEVVLWASLKTLIFGLIVLLVWVILPFLRVRTPKFHRLTWGAVLAVGLAGALVPMNIPLALNTGPEPENVEIAELPNLIENEIKPETIHSEISVDLGEVEENDLAGVFAENGGHAKNTTVNDEKIPAGDVFSAYEEWMFGNFRESHENSIQPKPNTGQPEENRAAVAVFANPTSAAIESVESRNFSWSCLLLAVWGSGVVVLAGWRLWLYLRLMNRLKTALPAEDVFAGQWNELLDEYRIDRKRLRLLLSDGLGPGLVWRLGGPVVVIPSELWFETSQKIREGILRHEIAHYLHRDLSLGFAARLVALLHWFNPMGWIAARKFEEAAEWMADAMAFGSENDGELVFAESMLAIHNSSPSILLNRPAFGGGKFLRRVKFLQYAHTKLGDSMMKRTFLALAVLLVLLFGALRPNFVPIQAGEKAETALETAIETTEAEKPEEKTEAAAEKTEDDADNFTASFSGRVVDKDGRPITDVKIYAMIERPSVSQYARTAIMGKINSQLGSMTRNNSIRLGQFSVDSDGRFDFKVPAEGEATIYFNSSEFPVVRLNTDRRGELDDIVLKTENAVKAKVRVLSPEGEPIPGLWAYLMPRAIDIHLAGCAKSGDDGTCEFKPMAPGEYVLTVVKTPLVIPPIRESHTLPYAFPRMNITLGDESKDFAITALESCDLVIRFDDKRDIFSPEYKRKGWPNQIVVSDMGTVLGWHLYWGEGESLGEGVYRYRVPRDKTLIISGFQDGSEFLYRLGNETELKRFPDNYLALGRLEKNLEIELVDQKSPTLNLEAFGEDGEPILEYWAYCANPELDDEPGIEEVDGSWRLKGKTIAGLIFGMNELEPATVLKSASNFALAPKTGKSSINRIRPNQKLLVFLFDKEGRQSTLELNLKPGIEETHKVTLKSTGPIPELDQARPIISGRFLDEQGNPVPKVKLAISAEKPPALKNGPYDRVRHSMTSDADGRFSWTLPCEGEVSIMVMPEDFAAVCKYYEKIETKNADCGDIVLEKGTRPSVRVLDSDGNPRADVLVFFTMAPGPGKSTPELSHFFCAAEKPTASDGTTKMPILLPGKYNITVNEYRPPDENKLGMNFPMKTVQISPGSFEFEIKAIEISAQVKLPTNGRVVDENANPVANATVTLAMKKPTKYQQYQGEAYQGSGTSDMDGRFTLRYIDLVGADELTEGTMSVSVKINDEEKSDLAAKAFELDLGSDLEDIVMEKGVRPVIRVLDHNGKPVSGVYLNMMSTEPPFWSVIGESPSDEDGLCEMPAVKIGPSMIFLNSAASKIALESSSSVFPIRTLNVSEDTRELEYRGIETVSLKFRFADEIRPEKTFWLRLVAYKEGEYNWTASPNDLESFGNGVYRNRKVPKNIPLSFSLDLGDEWVYSCAIPGIEKPIPATLPEFGTFDKDTEITITRQKAAKAEIKCVDEDGRKVEEFYLIGMYPGHPQKDYFKTERVEDGGYRLDVADLEQRFLGTKSVDYFDFALPFKFSSIIEYEWNPEERKGRALRIRPDEKVQLFAFDKSDRQGYIETTFSAGEERKIRIEMKAAKP